MASLMLYSGAMSLHPLFFFMFTGCLVAAVFLTGAEMEGRDGYR